MGTHKINPLSLEIGDIIKDVGEVTWLLNRGRYYTVVNVYLFEDGKVHHKAFSNDKEVEVIRE